MARRKRYDEDLAPEVSETIEDESPVIKEPKEPDTKRGIVCNAQHVRVRKEPSGTSSTLMVLDKGDEVTILGKSTETFYKIALEKDRIGYISCNYCEEVS